MTKPLRIGLIAQGGHYWIGGSEYTKNIVFALASLPAEIRSTFEVCLICSQPSDNESYNDIQPYIHKTNYSGVLIHPYTFQESAVKTLTLRERLFYPVQKHLCHIHNPLFDTFLKQHGIDFVYPYFSRGNTNRSYRSAAWISDFQHKYLPQFFSAQEISSRESAFSLMARYAPTIVLSSKTAETDFQNFFPEAAHKSTVLSFRTFPRSSWYEQEPVNIQHQYSLPDRFFLISNQFWQHKNHLVTFKALHHLHNRSIRPIIICTGSLHDYRQPDYSNTIMQTIHRLGLAHQIYLLGILPKIEQIQLMRRAIAVIQPSLFEGWNTVVEEARCLGKPIILSDLPVHIEQNVPHSCFFERHSAESLASVLSEWWQRLPPGPDPEEEAIAKVNVLEKIQTMGARFLKIARGENNDET